MPLRRLHLAGDIRAVFAARTVVHGPAMAVHLRRREDDAPGRVAVVAGRRVGTAVVRNRAKRRLRAALHELTVPRGVDAVVVARASAVELAYPRLCAQLGEQLSRAYAGRGTLERVALAPSSRHEGGDRVPAQPPSEGRDRVPAERRSEGRDRVPAERRR